MSDVVSFGGDIDCKARAATLETIFDQLARCAPDHAEFRELLAQREIFDAIGGWFFDALSPDALDLLMRIVDEMNVDLPAVAARANWVEDRRPIFYADVARFRAALADRIARLD